MEKHLQLPDNGTPAPPKKVEKSEEEWKEILTPAQFRVMRMKGTERAHTGELCSFYEAGRYACVGCDTELFDSNLKFDSGTDGRVFLSQSQTT